MSKERVHIAIREPENRCLQLSRPMELKEALRVAARYTELLSHLKGLAFIEEEGIKATKELQCGRCNWRVNKRQDFESLI